MNERKYAHHKHKRTTIKSKSKTGAYKRFIYLFELMYLRVSLHNVQILILIIQFLFQCSI